MYDELFDKIIEGTLRHSKLIVENLGIKIKLLQIPEYKEYFDYAVDCPWYLKLLRKIFMRHKIEQLHSIALVAFINQIMEE